MKNPIRSRKLFGTLAGLVLASAGVASTAAAVAPHSFFTALRSNDGGTTIFQIAPSAGHFCYLSRVGVREVDTANELATCRVLRGSSAWTLEAILSEDGDHDIECSAYCYSN